MKAKPLNVTPVFLLMTKAILFTSPDLKRVLTTSPAAEVKRASDAVINKPTPLDVKSHTTASSSSTLRVENSNSKVLPVDVALFANGAISTENEAPLLIKSALFTQPDEAFQLKPLNVPVYSPYDHTSLSVEALLLPTARKSNVKALVISSMSSEEVLTDTGTSLSTPSTENLIGNVPALLDVIL